MHGDEIVECGERVETREEFCEFVKELFANFQQHPEEWENNSMDAYLEGIGLFAKSMDGYYRNIGERIDCDTASWRIFADILLAARVYN
jgi:hypothetical protein